MTVLTYMSMVNHTRDALDSTGIEADLVDLRFLDRASLDWDTVGESIRKNKQRPHRRAGGVGTSYGGWLAGWKFNADSLITSTNPSSGSPGPKRRRVSPKS